MSRLSNIDRVLGRIKSIESRINSLSANYAQTPAAASSFKQILKTERERPSDASSQTQNKLTPDSDSLEKLKAAIGSKQRGALLDILVGENDSNDLPDSLPPLKTTDSLAALIKSAAKEETPTASVAKDWLVGEVEKNPRKIIKFDDYDMQAATAFKFRQLEGLIKKKYPNRGIYVTSTTGGKHVSPAHPAGRAVDFVVDKLTADESREVEKMAKDCGFYVLNEYIYNSPYKTGDHMHIEM
jgi:hypothetical protein